ncbi:MAG TPA: nickel-dependent lactate racemase [Myxococcales bacterium]|nr:nickel-dependent lactate racemase [Myxococcales bacterium]
MRIELSFGRGTLPVDLPAGLEVTVIRKPAMPVLQDAGAAVRAALDRPVGARPLIEEARGKKSACILICDVTRPVPNALLLQPIVRDLMAAGMPAAGITVLVATGLHRPNLGAELDELVGDPWVQETVRVENHYARNDEDHLDLGFTPSGTPVKLDRRFVQAELKLVTGLVEPHFMAGYSGGRKVIAPGVAHRDTITTFHSERFMSNPRAENCVLSGNPLHEEQLVIAGMVGPVLSADVVIDEARRLSFISFGEVVQSHARAVAFAERHARVPVSRRFKTVVTSAAGHPLDKTYYQTVKGMVAPLDILEPGGNLIVASECSEGMGSAGFVEAQRRLLRLGPDGFLREIAKKRFADIDEWQTQMQIKSMRAGRIQLYCTGPVDRALTGVAAIESVARAVEESAREMRDPQVAVVPEGPYVVPFFQPAGGAAPG